MLRTSKSAPNNAAKNITSLKMNQLMLQRNYRSTCRLYRRPSDSPMTVPNHPNSMTSSTQNPPSTTQGPAGYWLNQNAAPVPISSSAHEPRIGQCDGCGTK